MLRQCAYLFRKSGVLLREDVQLLFCGQFGLDDSCIHKLLMVGFSLAHGIIGKTLHFPILLDRYTDLPRPLHVLYIDCALSVRQREKR